MGSERKKLTSQLSIDIEMYKFEKTKLFLTQIWIYEEKLLNWKSVNDRNYYEFLLIK